MTVGLVAVPKSGSYRPTLVVVVSWILVSSRWLWLWRRLTSTIPPTFSFCRNSEQKRNISFFSQNERTRISKGRGSHLGLWVMFGKGMRVQFDHNIREQIIAASIARKSMVSIGISNERLTFTRKRKSLDRISVIRRITSSGLFKYSCFNHPPIIHREKIGWLISSYSANSSSCRLLNRLLSGNRMPQFLLLCISFFPFQQKVWGFPPQN